MKYPNILHCRFILQAWAGRVALASLAALAACGSDDPTPPPGVEVASVTIESQSFALERGFHRALGVVVRGTRGDTLDVPVVWRSSNEAVATIDRLGRITALDTGLTAITATTLGVASPPIAVRVVWLGAATLSPHEFTAPAAASPGVVVRDSVRVVVTSRTGAPVPNARVAFSVTAGGGSVSPSVDTTDAAGRAAAQLTLGPEFGINTVRAVVLSDDETPLAFVEGAPLALSVTTFAAIEPVAGDAQTGQILAALPVPPSVRLVDAAGNPRPGIPVTFTALQGGRVASPTVSTGADGIATPGSWTLGDTPGAQSLLVSVESARLTLTATGTGTPVFYAPSQVVAGGFATCGITATGAAECFGEQPKVGDSSTTNRSRPTPVKGDLVFRTVAGSPAAVSPQFTVGIAHFCGITTGDALYCWGLFSYADTTGDTLHTLKPARVASDVVWSQVAPGVLHNCALSAPGTAICWGDNTYGQLGDGTLTRRAAPGAVSGGFTFARIASGSFHSCGLSTGGSAFCWGLNQSGQLGDGTTTSRSSPTAVGGSHTYQSIGAGEALTCALSTAGVAYCWGALSAAQPRQATPRAYTTAPVFTSLTVGGGHACGLAADGSAYCWGSNAAGQLGDSTTAHRAEPVPVAGGFRYSAISAGYQHTCGTTTDGAVACWGLNRAGELGDSTVSSRAVPRRIVLEVKP